MVKTRDYYIILFTNDLTYHTGNIPDTDIISSKKDDTFWLAKAELESIDYDYKNEDSIINLTMYIYKENNQIVKEKETTFQINITDGIIKPIKKKQSLKQYDIYYQKEIDKQKPMIALTFDDGPNYNTNKILDILEKYNIKATFFILGKNIKENESIIKRMKNLNMEIGNHMYTHKFLNQLTDKEIKEEEQKVDNLLENITGEKPTLIRPSYGTTNNRIKKLTNKPIIIWNIDTQDWKYHNSKKIYKKVLKNISNGDIILMHDIYRATSNSLEIIIPELLKKDYQFLTVTELLYYKGKELKKGKVYSHA